MQNNSITPLIIGMAVAVGMSVLAISAVAQPPVEPTQATRRRLSSRTVMVLPRRKLTSGSVIVSSSRAIFSIGHTTGSDKPSLDKADWKATRFPSTGLVYIASNLCLCPASCGVFFCFARGHDENASKMHPSEARCETLNRFAKS